MTTRYDKTQINTNHSITRQQLPPLSNDIVAWSVEKAHHLRQQGIMTVFASQDNTILTALALCVVGYTAPEVKSITGKAVSPNMEKRAKVRPLTVALRKHLNEMRD